MKTALKAPCKAIAYVRVSTGKQEISPEDQRERIEAYCKLAGLQLAEVIVEKGVSAKLKLAKRPAGAKVAELIRDGVCHVVALKLDRLFRNAADALAVTEEWNRAGIRLHLVDLGGMSLDTGTPMGRMFFTMMAGFAEMERSLISERTTAALRYQKAHGQVYNHLPYGFNAADGALVPNQGEQAVLARLRAMRKAGLGYDACAKELNADAVPAKLGGQWFAAGIRKVLGAAG